MDKTLVEITLTVQREFMDDLKQVSAAHNQLMAERDFGAEHMNRFKRKG